jgi:hypothetical protein
MSQAAAGLSPWIWSEELKQYRYYDYGLQRWIYSDGWTAPAGLHGRKEFQQMMEPAFQEADRAYVNISSESRGDGGYLATDSTSQHAGRPSGYSSMAEDPAESPGTQRGAQFNQSQAKIDASSDEINLNGKGGLSIPFMSSMLITASVQDTAYELFQRRSCVPVHLQPGSRPNNKIVRICYRVCKCP